MNNADVVAGWTGFSLALVIGYGAYKNKPVFGPKGIVSTTIQTGKVGTGGAGNAATPSAPPSTPNHTVYVPGRGLVDPAPVPNTSVNVPGRGLVDPAPLPASTTAASGGILSTASNLLKGLFGGTPTGSGIYV